MDTSFPPPPPPSPHKREIDIDKEGRNIQARRGRIIMEGFTFLSYGFLKEEKKKESFFIPFFEGGKRR